MIRQHQGKLQMRLFTFIRLLICFVEPSIAISFSFLASSLKSLAISMNNRNRTVKNKKPFTKMHTITTACGGYTFHNLGIGNTTQIYIFSFKLHQHCTAEMPVCISTYILSIQFYNRAFSFLRIYHVIQA